MRGALVGVVAVLQEQFVGLGVVGIALEHRGTSLAEQLQLQGGDNRWLISSCSSKTSRISRS